MLNHQRTEPEALASLVRRMERAFEEVVQEFSAELDDPELMEALLRQAQPVVEVRSETIRCVVVPRARLRQRLTEREREIAALIRQAKSNKAIAERLGIKLPTVAAHLRRIYDKCGVDTRTGLATFMLGAQGVEEA